MKGILRKDLTMIRLKKSWILPLLSLFPLCWHGIWPALGLVFLVPFWVGLFWNAHSDFGLCLPWRWHQMVFTRLLWLIVTLIPVPLGGLYWAERWEEPYRLRDAGKMWLFLLCVGCILLLVFLPRMVWQTKRGARKGLEGAAAVAVKVPVLAAYVGAVITYCFWFLILLIGNVNLSVEAAAPYWADIHNTPKIEFGNYIVFYRTDNTIDSYSDKWISEIAPVSHNILYTQTITDGRNAEVVRIADTGERAGFLYTYEADGQYHNFFMPEVTLSDWTQIPEFVRLGYDKVIVSGQEIGIFKHSYFITDAPVEDFEISGVPLTINDPGIDPPPGQYSETIAVYSGHLGRDFLFESNGTFEYSRGGGAVLNGVYEKTETGIILYFREKGEIVETVDLTFTEAGNFLYDATEFHCSNKEDAWDTYPLYTKPVC